MLFACKRRWNWIAITLLTAVLSAQGVPLSAAEPDFSNDRLAAAQQNEIKKMQEALRNRGDYGGKTDGVFGRQTRAGVRAYQKAENLPVTGLLDALTASKLGVRPEGEVPGYKDAAGKPSALIAQTKGLRRTSKLLRKEAGAVAVPDNDPRGREKALQADNDSRPE